MTIEEAFKKKISDVPATIQGKVIEILEDDKEDDPHQRFIIKIQPNYTVLVAHNLEYAYRVPVREGDKLEVHGTYERNDLSGVIHKTHHDGRGVHEDGWINFVGRKHPDFSKKH